jgi:predicted TIM-barrel enzyme
MGKLSVHEGESLDKLRKVVGNGCKLLPVGAHTGLSAYCFVAQEDTTISAFSVDGANATSAYGLGALVTVKAGAYFVVPEGSQITAMTIDSGSVIIYNL